MRTSSARRSKVSELGLLTGRWFKKYFSAWRPSLLGITVYKDVISMVKMILFSPEKLKVRKISSAWLLSLIYEGSDLTMGRFTRYDFVACDNGLRQAHDMIYDCCVRQKKCRSILKHVLKRCDNRKSCRRPVVSLSHATKSYRVNRPYERHDFV